MTAAVTDALAANEDGYMVFRSETGKVEVRDGRDGKLRLLVNDKHMAYPVILCVARGTADQIVEAIREVRGE